MLLQKAHSVHDDGKTKSNPNHCWLFQPLVRPTMTWSGRLQANAAGRSTKVPFGAVTSLMQLVVRRRRALVRFPLGRMVGEGLQHQGPARLQTVLHSRSSKELMFSALLLERRRQSLSNDAPNCWKSGRET